VTRPAPSRHPSHDGRIWDESGNVAGHHGAGRDYGGVADNYALQNRDSSAQPNVASHHNGCVHSYWGFTV